eukprot:CAMPEP_0169174904 /NCGR_PEP_ID=MMETSP1015-20121227/64860_1 /TAXON_ID=342587 /ORGANISM="Karlodinium micrum, Strain CCMP2283" /LENGTH=93 /DNA_ID=CAMNT_0009248925 /DNA_START=44 /DNA_END=325 /DNA_ORIENTATION=+
MASSGGVNSLSSSKLHRKGRAGLRNSGSGDNNIRVGETSSSMESHLEGLNAQEDTATPVDILRSDEVAGQLANLLTRRIDVCPEMLPSIVFMS